MPRRGGGRRTSPTRASTAPRRSPQIDRLSDAELAPRLEALYYLGWAENYLERYDDAIAHVDRGIAIARATGEGRLLVPMMLVKGYPFEMQGRLAEAIELCEAAVEASRLSANPHYLFWSLFELGWAHYYAGDLDGAIAACEESARVGRRLAGGTMPASGGGPGWALGCARFEVGEVERAREMMHALGSDDLAHKIPVERCFDWEILALVELALGDVEAAEELRRRARGARRELDGLHLPAALALPRRARRVLLATRRAAARRRASAAQAALRPTRVGARLQCRVRAQPRRAARSPRRASATSAIAVLRAAEAELDACGSRARARRDAPRAAQARRARREARAGRGGRLRRRRR